jgi:spermidine synthase
MFSYRIKRKLFEKKTPFQLIEIFETEGCGNLMALDGCFMLTDMEEFVYHDMIVHVPLFSHPNPQDVLVIGGGDGGTVREILRHNTVKRVDFAEIDEEVFKAALKYHKGLVGWVGDKRVNYCFSDGCAFVKDKVKTYDVVIIDSTDPVDIGEGLFTKEFYADVKKSLKPGGCMVAQTEDPFYDAEFLMRGHNKIRDTFKQAHLYLASIPTYPSGTWSFTYGSDTISPLEIRNKKTKKLKTRYYTPELHKAAFVLPQFVQDLIKTGKSSIELKGKK